MINGFDMVLKIINTIVSTLEAVNAVKGVIGLISSFIPGAGAIGALTGSMPMPLSPSGMGDIKIFMSSELEEGRAVATLGRIQGKVTVFNTKKTLG